MVAQDLLVGHLLEESRLAVVSLRLVEPSSQLFAPKLDATDHVLAMLHALVEWLEVGSVCAMRCAGSLVGNLSVGGNPAFCI